MRRPFLLVVLIAAALFVGMWVVAPYRGNYYGGGWWGPQMSGPGMWGGYGPGMMRGPGWTGWNQSWRDLNLSTNDVKTYLERSLAWQGNPRLKLGDVKEKDADTIVADIVTKDNSLVQRYLVNRHNGYYRASED